MKKIFTLFVVVCTTSGLWAKFTVDGIVYNLLDGNNVEVTYTGNNSSAGNTYSDSVAIPATVTYQDQTYCVTKIGDWAFHDCPNLTAIAIPYSITSIGINAFKECENIKSVVWNAKNCGVWKDEDGYTLSFGSQVESFVFGDSVEVITPSLCAGMDLLTTVYIPKAVRRIYVNAFDVCTGLTAFRVDKENTHYCDVDGVLYTIAQDSLLMWPASNPKTTCTIPYGVVYVEYQALANCNNIKTVIWNAKNSVGCSFGVQVETFMFGDGVEVIPASLCLGLTKLRSITIPTSVTNIGKQAFYGCYNIKSVEWNAKNCNAYEFGYQVESFIFGDSVEVIPASLCSEIYGLKQVTFGSSLLTIKENAFYADFNIEEMVCYAAQAPAVEEGAITSISSSAKLYVPEEYITTYQSDPNWGRFDIRDIAEKMDAGEGTEIVKDNAAPGDKFIRDGHLYIRRDNITYSVMGF